MSTEQAYDEIEVLEGLEGVRLRPGMYAGSTVENEYNSAPMHLVKEAVGNSIDEFLNGHATYVRVDTHEDGSISVEDDGRGIPFSMNAKHKVSNLELAFTKLHGGAKFRKSSEGSAFKVSAGLHGVGVKIICALGDWLLVTVWRDGQEATMSFGKGKVAKPLETKLLPFNNAKKHGTRIQWKQDPSILPNNPKLEHIRQYLTFCAYINEGMQFFLNGEDLSQPRGLIALAEVTIPRDQWHTSKPITIHSTDEAGNSIETVIAFTKREGEQHLAFVNGGAINQASAPVVAMRGAAAKGISNAIEATFGKMPSEVTSSDLRSGLLTISKILHVEPAYDSQTKEKFTPIDLNPMINEQVPANIVTVLMKDHDTLNHLRNHINLLVKARQAAAAARAKAMGQAPTPKREKNNKPVSLDIYTPPLSEDPKLNQLFLFEGESASGTLTEAAKEKRPDGKLYKENIGILALRGVMLGTYQVPLSQILGQNPQYSMLVDKSGLNPDNPDDLSGLKYRDFVISTDEDNGGNFIANQLAMFFIEHFPEVIRQGRLKRIRTPLFEVVPKDGKSRFIYEWQDKDQALIELGFDPTKAGKSYDVKRSKGLGALSQTARMTLVQDQKFDVYQHDTPEELLPLIHLLVSKASDGADNRKDIMMNLVFPEDVD